MSWLLYGLTGFLGPWFKELINEFIKFSTTKWGLILIVVGAVWYLMNDTVGAITLILSAISGIATSRVQASPSGSNALWLLSVCNTFAPMDELFSYGAAYFLLVGAFGLYRLIKSWIPGGFAGGS